jgi:hypothetical protein
MYNENINSNKFGLNQETVFFILVDSKTVWTTLPVPIRIDTLKRQRTFMLPHQQSKSEQ